MTLRESAGPKSEESEHIMRSAGKDNEIESERRSGRTEHPSSYHHKRLESLDDMEQPTSTPNESP